MKKRILYIGYNFSPELTGIGKYSGEMMDWLARSGHDCTVVTSFPYYPQWRVQPPYRGQRFWFRRDSERYSSGGRLNIFRCPMYVPKNPTGLKRIISDFSFFISGLFQIFAILFKKKYDYVITVSPTFLAGVLGVFYKKIKKAKHVHHIQDLQIEAAHELGMIKSNVLVNFLFKIEDYVFKNSEVISSISDTMIKRLAKKSQREIAFLPNWVDTGFFYPLKSNGSLKSKFGFRESDKVILYSGGIGAKQGLENILFAAKSLERHLSIKFVICGSGPYKEVLKNRADSMGLSNISFLPLQPKEDFNDFLNMADIHLIIQKKNASDLVMPSKLTTILAVGGVALVTADEGTDLYHMVSKHEMGLLVGAEDKEKLTQGILGLVENYDVENIRTNAYNYAKKYLNLDKIMEKFDKELL